MKHQENNEDLEARFIALLQNELSETEKTELEQLIQNSAELKADFKATKDLWQQMGNTISPEPKPAMKMVFQEMLVDFKKETENKKPFSFQGLIENFKKLFVYSPSHNWAYALLLLGTGSIIGFYSGKSDSQTLANNQEVQKLGQEVQQMKQLMMISMLDNPVASERIKAVSFAEEINEIDEQIIDALLTTFNFDENVNVRLITLEALLKLADHPKVREGLVQALLKQESPLVQVALADAMMALQEKRSVEQIEELLKKKDLNTFVKDKLEQTLIDLI